MGGWLTVSLPLPVLPDPTLPLSQATPTAHLVPLVSSDIRVHLLHLLLTGARHLPLARRQGARVRAARPAQRKGQDRIGEEQTGQGCLAWHRECRPREIKRSTRSGLGLGEDGVGETVAWSEVTL